MTEILLVQNHRKSRPGEYWWGFPKGHVESGETMEQAAEREVREETGISARISAKVGDSQYIITMDGQKVNKTVTVFLMDFISGQPQPQITEVSDVRWMDSSQALAALTFENDKILLKKALDIIQNK